MPKGKKGRGADSTGAMRSLLSDAERDDAAKHDAEVEAARAEARAEEAARIKARMAERMAQSAEITEDAISRREEIANREAVKEQLTAISAKLGELTQFLKTHQESISPGKRELITEMRANIAAHLAELDKMEASLEMLPTDTARELRSNKTIQEIQRERGVHEADRAAGGPRGAR